MQNIKEKIEEIIKILDCVYEAKIHKLKEKRSNLKKINIETLKEHVELDFEKGALSNERDLVKYIETIIED